MYGKYWDKGLQLIDGCTPCSPGCEHCWSAVMEQRFRGDVLTAEDGLELVYGGKFTGAIITHPERLSIPLKRRKPTVYAIWNDLFHEAAPDNFIDNAFSVMEKAQQHTFLVLTKRPGRMSTAWPVHENIYHGLTVCNQQEADEKIPVFLQVPGKKFLSIEPAIAPVTLWEHHLGVRLVECFDVIIMGAETGSGARPMDLEWALTIRDECEVTGIPFFLKQVDKNRNRLLDGREHNDLPWRTP